MSPRVFSTATRHLHGVSLCYLMNPSLTQVAAFVRQHSHDLRNDLTAIELDAVLLASVFPSGEAAEIVDRLRTQIRKMAAGLQDLAAHFAETKTARISMPVHELFGVLKNQAMADGAELTWQESVGDSRVNVDANSLAKAFRELLANAVKFGDGSRLTVTAAVESEHAVFSLHEPKANPVNPDMWGSVPFAAVKRGSYGLGLWEANRIVAANGGAMARTYKDGNLITILTFPVEQPVP